MERFDGPILFVLLGDCHAPKRPGLAMTEEYGNLVIARSAATRRSQNTTEDYSNPVIARRPQADVAISADSNVFIGFIV